MKISEFIKLLETRKKQFGNIDVVDDLGYITNDLIYNEEDDSLMIVTDTIRKVKKMKKIEIISDKHRHHVYVGNTDFWIDNKELVELYLKLGHVEP